MKNVWLCACILIRRTQKLCATKFDILSGLKKISVCKHTKCSTFRNEITARPFIIYVIITNCLHIDGLLFSVLAYFVSHSVVLDGKRRGCMSRAEVKTEKNRNLSLIAIA